MEYLYEIAWFSLWPIIIYLGWKMSVKNVSIFEEKLK